MARLFIGRSGCFYRHWEKEVFYPTGLLRKEQLRYYSEFFSTVELNSPSYRLPSESTFLRWYDLTPEDFLFTVKVSRFISHVKYLRDCEIPWFTFYQRSERLKKKLGPFLIQLPPNWKRNLARLEEFIQMLKNISPKEKIAFEFRHISWFDKEVYNFFGEQRNITMVQTDSARWPSTPKIAGSFVYVRMHGAPILYGSKYSEKYLTFTFLTRITLGQIWHSSIWLERVWFESIWTKLMVYLMCELENFGKLSNYMIGLVVLLHRRSTARIKPTGLHSCLLGS